MTQKPEFVALGTQSTAGILKYNIGVFFRSVMKGSITLTPEEAECFKKATGDGVHWEMSLVERPPQPEEKKDAESTT